MFIWQCSSADWIVLFCLGRLAEGVKWWRWSFKSNMSQPKEKIPQKRDICTGHAGLLYMHFDRMRLQHDWSYATVQEIVWTWTDLALTPQKHYIFSMDFPKTNQVLLMQCTVCLLWCKRSVKLYGLQGAHVLPLMLSVHTVYKLSVLICAISFCG